MQISLDPSARELMNADLEQLYDQHYRSLASLRATHPGLSHPLLLRVPEGYARAPVRLLVLGQETNGWASGLADVTGNEMVRRLLSHYEEFRLGLGYRKGQFWRAVRSLEARLGVEPGKVVWGNLNRCDLGRKSPPGSLAQDLMRAFPVLSAEVTITRPGVVVFFTGPRFDDHIRWAWPGADFQQLAGGLPARQLARVVHPLLPRNSFRTYHPKFLSMAKSSEEVLGLIAAHAGV